MKSLRSKISQMLIMGFSGCSIHENSTVVEWLKKDGLGGVLLFDYDLSAKRFGKNLKNKEQIIELNQTLQYFSKKHSTHETLPLFIALDYEGGAVDRLAKIDGCRVSMKPCAQALLSDEALALETQKMAATLSELGFNLNFAPVVDLNLNEQEGIIGKLGRSFAREPHTVIRAAKQFVSAFAEQGVICSYKHFPGHGSATGDTHLGFVDVTETWQEQELEPYKVLFKTLELPAMVMTAHVVNRHLDKTGLPATLSFSILTALLRQQLGFEGVIISDDLQMHAISEHYSLQEALSLTINAGADMVIFGNQWGETDATHVVDTIEHLVQHGVIELARIEEAYSRISSLKKLITPLHAVS